jgi:hypothetical protein
MQVKTTSGSGAAGLGVIGTGLALALPDAKWIGWLLVAMGLLVFLFDIRIERGQIRAGGSRLHQFGPWVLIIGGPLLGAAWLYFQNAPTSDSNDGQLPLARLADLGWSIKSGPDSIQFGVSAAPLPPMEESSKYFRLLRKPFNLALQQVKNLDGLHYLADVPGCSKIEIGAGEFTDISELRGFSNLTNLVIGQLPLNGTATVDLAPLSSLVNLETLVLNMVRARTIEPLAPLTKLKSLNVGQSLISDITSVSGMSLLESLEIRGTRVSDLQPLSKSNNLKELTISGAQIPGLINLSHLVNLKKVTIIEQQGTDLSAVGTLTNLESLWIWGGPTPLDISPLHSLTALRALTITGFFFGAHTAVPNIRVIGDLKELETVTLGSLQVNDVTFLQALKNLKEINLNQLPISSIEALRNLKAIKKLSLIDIPVVDISVLLELPALISVTVIRVPARADVITELERRGVKVN